MVLRGCNSSMMSVEVLIIEMHIQIFPHQECSKDFMNVALFMKKLMSCNYLSCLHTRKNHQKRQKIVTVPQGRLKSGYIVESLDEDDGLDADLKI